MLAFKYFLDTLPKEKAEKCALLKSIENKTKEFLD